MIDDLFCLFDGLDGVGGVGCGVFEWLGIRYLFEKCGGFVG